MTKNQLRVFMLLVFASIVVNGVLRTKDNNHMTQVLADSYATHVKLQEHFLEALESGDIEGVKDMLRHTIEADKKTAAAHQHAASK